MSYLEVPRLHFSGKFFAVPSTINNDIKNYDTTVVPPADPGWNPNGLHYFSLQNCTVTSTVDSTGLLATASGDDSAVGATVDPVMSGKLVDIDPDFQTYSTVFGLGLSIASGGKSMVSGTMRPVALRDLWGTRARAPAFGAFGGIYYTVLRDLTWGATTSPVLSSLATISRTQLSLKLTLFAYDIPSTTGMVVGTIVRSTEIDDELFVTRRAMMDPQSTAFGKAPWRPNVALNKLTIDLGNALPETSAGGPRVNLGTLSAVAIDDSVNPPTTTPLGSSIPFDAARLLVTSGVVDVAGSAADMASLATKRLGLMVTSPSNRLIMSERPSGIYMSALVHSFRVSPGDTFSLNVRVSQFGGPKATHTVALAHRDPGRPGASALSFPTTATASAGDATFRITASDPKSPRPNIDGQCFELVYGDSPLTPSNVWGTAVVLVFDAFTAPKSPTWADIEPIFKRYAHLFPSMKGIMDLSSHAVVADPANIARLIKVLNASEDSWSYMPVSRDLSPPKRAMILKWLAAGAP